MDITPADNSLRKIVTLVALLNLCYFGVEFAVALSIGSVSLFADSIDFLEDASVNFLIVAALGWSPVRRARVGMALAVILLVPGFATLWTAWVALDSMGKVPFVGTARASAVLAGRWGGACYQSGLRLYACWVPRTWGKPDACGFPLCA